VTAIEDGLVAAVLAVVVISAARTLGVNMSRRLVSIGTALGRSLLGMRSDHPLRRRRPTKVTTRIAITPASA
jgi:Flp pilus assembly pilin Flp